MDQNPTGGVPQALPIVPSGPIHIAPPLPPPAPAGSAYGPFGLLLDILKQQGLAVAALFVVGYGAWILVQQQREDMLAREKMFVSQLDSVLRDVQKDVKDIRVKVDDVQKDIARLGSGRSDRRDPR